MKKLLFVIGLFLIIPAVFAVNVDLKESYEQRETLIGKISGNFQEPISEEDIVFYKRHIRVPLSVELFKLGNDYYFYTQLLNKQKDNYSVEIKDVSYYDIDEIVKEDIKKNFTISNTSAEFSVNPGVVYTNSSFFIEIQNLLDKEIFVDITLPNETKTKTSFFDFFSSQQDGEITLSPKEKKKINFKIKNITKDSVQKIEISSNELTYSIPVYIYEFNKTKKEEETISLEFQPSQLKSFIVTNQSKKTYSKKILLKNTGTKDVENLTFFISNSLKNYLSINKTNITKIEKNDTEQITLLINASINKDENIQGYIMTEFDSENFYLPVYLNYTRDFVPSNESDSNTSIIDDNDSDATNDSKDKTIEEKCSEEGGNLCTSNEKCIGEKKYFGEKECCFGRCEKQEQNSTLKIIGWIIVIAVILFVIWFYFYKYKGAEKTVNLLDKAKGK